MLRNAGLLYGLLSVMALGHSTLSGAQQEVKAEKPAVAAEAEKPNPSGDIDPDQALEKAVAVARAGDNKRALKMLDKLIKARPDYYPARRDFIVVAAWDNQCELAWQRFQALKAQTQYEDYVVQPLAECLRDMRRHEEAGKLLLKAAKNSPENQEIKSAQNDLNHELAVRLRPQLDSGIGYSQSEQGAHEWHFRTKYSQSLNPANRVYARYLLKRATDPSFETGNMDRIGVGLQSWLSNDDVVDLEVSTDVQRGEEQSGRIEYTHYLGRRWEFAANYSSFSEDVPLRAKAQNIEANSAGASAAFHTLDYRYEWFASVSRNHFSDTNTRRSVATGAGYAFELKPQREMRVLLDVYQSDNSLDGVIYYNPEHDSTVTLSVRGDWVLDTKYDRHVQRLTLYVANHEQRHYDSKVNYGAKYEIDLQISEQSAVSMSAQYGRASYDGNSEDEGSLEVGYSRKF